MLTKQRPPPHRNPPASTGVLENNGKNHHARAPGRCFHISDAKVLRSENTAVREALWIRWIDLTMSDARVVNPGSRKYREGKESI